MKYFTTVIVIILLGISAYLLFDVCRDKEEIRAYEFMRPSVTPADIQKKEDELSR